ARKRWKDGMALKIMILGANGFIGSALTNAILRTRPWEVYGIDLADNKLGELPKTDRFHFVEGDITINKEWVEYHVKKCDAVVPLVAIANPAQYVTHPLRVFELDFEANIDVVRHCVKYGKRLIFPSTSEIYGMSPDAVLDEESSPLVYGPIHKQRWIYAASKQSGGWRHPEALLHLHRRRHRVPAHHPREQGQPRQPPYLQHRQPRQLRLDPRSRAAHHPHRAGVRGAARERPCHRDRGHLRRRLLRQVLPGHPGTCAQHRGRSTRPGLGAHHRHGYRHPSHHRVLRQAGRLHPPRGGTGGELAPLVPGTMTAVLGQGRRVYRA